MRVAWSTARRRFGTLVIGAALATTAAAAQAAEIAVRNAWMRPAAQGSAAARAYLDIESDVPVELVGAASPYAMQVEIVRTAVIGDPATESVVEAYPIAARSQARLAYRGDHLRLVMLLRTARNGEPVPATLVFKDPAGLRIEVPVAITVRGLL